MKLRYSYHSEHHADTQDRWMHFLLFAGALLLLFAAGQQFFLFFTDWHAADHEHSWWPLGLGALYLFFGLGIAYLGYRLDSNSRGNADRYIRIDEDYLSWHLHQQDQVEQVALAEVAEVERTNIRDLVISLKSGSKITLPIYLVGNEAKQKELITVLQDQL
ncbi:MAG: hypothetical protein AAGF89_08180 [Bacteroidota bacterium]